MLGISQAALSDPRDLTYTTQSSVTAGTDEAVARSESQLASSNPPPHSREEPHNHIRAESASSSVEILGARRMVVAARPTIQTSMYRYAHPINDTDTEDDPKDSTDYSEA